MDTRLDPNHFLSLSRPNALSVLSEEVPDTTTLAAHDFDVDARTGFMPPQPPLARLPSEWEAWECTLESAIRQKLQLGDSPGLHQEEKDKSEAWRVHVRSLPILSTTALTNSEITIRRAHHVLAWILHFYVHTQLPSPPPYKIYIPPPLAVPLLQVSTQLQLPPVLTYSDNVLYNWDFLHTSPADDDIMQPSPDNLRCQTTFTSTPDEAAFYLTCARIELRGVAALDSTNWLASFVT